MLKGEEVMREVKFDIDAPEFAQAKMALNRMMQGLLHAIVRGQTEDGTVTLKVDIKSVKTTEGIAPSTEYKCTVGYKRKEDIDGVIYGDGQVLLEKGDDGLIYGLTEAPEQIAMEGIE